MVTAGGPLAKGIAPMADASPSTAELQALLDRIQAGDATARDELLGHACERLRRLTRKMLKGFAQVHRREQTDDVLQNALVRLWRALQAQTPRSLRAFYGLAALQIRRELLDLARHYHGPEGARAGQAGQEGEDSSKSTPPFAEEKVDTTHEPSRLAVWTEIHQRVEALPEEEREVFDLLWYQELKQAEAAALLDVSPATIRRRWLAARRRLLQGFKGQLPGW
jgi:RNA polymerase sigma-70 factor (ECF subfamily)